MCGSDSDSEAVLVPIPIPIPIPQAVPIHILSVVLFSSVVLIPRVAAILIVSGADWGSDSEISDEHVLAKVAHELVLVNAIDDDDARMSAPKSRLTPLGGGEFAWDAQAWQTCHEPRCSRTGCDTR